MRKITTLSDISPQAANANRHTARGLGALATSIGTDGWIGAITVAADGETFDGSARTEVGVAAGFAEAIVVDSDGSRPVIVRRVDVPTAADPRAKRLSLAANRIAQLNLDLDPAVVLAYADEGVALAGLYADAEIATLRALAAAEAAAAGAPLDPASLWAGMPEYEHEDKTAFQSLVVHFKDQAAVDAFAGLIGQKLTQQTRFVWYPATEIQSYMDKRYAPES